MPETTLTLYDPRNGDLAFEVEELSVGGEFTHRTNCFTMYLARSGRGRFSADLAEHEFQSPCLLFFSTYQTTRIASEKASEFLVLRFHANFLCIETYHHEVGCNGVLFNDPYGLPLVSLDQQSLREVEELIGRIRHELSEAGLAHAEVLLSYLKILLVKATRLKREQQGQSPGNARLPDLLTELRELVEKHYRTHHSPADYAELMNTTAKALGRLVKTHLGKTLSDLIREKLLTQAKWELLHTLRPVKEIARGIGYDDELYFSRVFKKSSGLSPSEFREFETAIRNGSNLSMSSSDPSIPK